MRISNWSSDVCSSDLSVAYDAAAGVLYVSEFGSALKPTEKDGQGRISKVALDGKVLEERFLPPAGQTLDKPKGIWVAGNRLWVTETGRAMWRERVGRHV